MPKTKLTVEQVIAHVLEKRDLGHRDSVTRYVATYINKDGLRTLMHAQQGQHTFATEAEAQRWIDACRKNNSSDVLKRTYGEKDTYEVRPCACYPGHFDPIGIYFDS